MHCPRCHGLMVKETYYDLVDCRLIGGMFEGWRCLNCGNVLDEIILAHHRYFQVFGLSDRCKKVGRPPGYRGC